MFKCIQKWIFVLIICYGGLLVAETAKHPIPLFIRGFASSEEIQTLQKTVMEANPEEVSAFVVEIQSTGADLKPLLELAKTLYERKLATNIPVIVYMDDHALGPVALLPFLADEIYTSVVVSWGDVELGTDRSYPVNLLRNQVTSYISEKNPQRNLLYILAQAMTDKNIQIIDDQGGWRVAVTPHDLAKPLLSTSGEPLVLNQQQLQKMHLVKGELSLTDFRKKFLSDYQEKEMEQAALSSGQTLSPNVSPTLDKRLKNAIVPNLEGENLIGYIKIDDRTSGITQATWIYIKNALDYYKQKKPLFIILELNTPGGEVFASQKISDALKEMDTQYNIPTVAFINNWAISAGAMLAYSTRFITIVKDASMGAAEPVMASQEGKMETASEKVNSALRADFANRAGFFGRNPAIAEAMVDKDIILVMRNGKIIKLDQESQIRTMGTDPDIIISPKGKLLTLNAQQLMAYEVADLLMLPEKIAPITSQEEASGKWPANKMLIFQYPFFKQIPNATVDAYKMDWKTRFFTILANPFVSSLLVLGLMVGFYMEMSTPGFGLPGTVAVTCLFLIMLSSFALEAANWLEVIFLLAGLVIILVDLLVLPTFGLMGTIGALLFLVGLFSLLLPGLSSVSFEYDTQTFNAAGEFVMQRLAWLCGALVASVGIIFLLARYVMPHFTPFQRLVLKGDEQDATKGYIAGDNPKELPQPGTKGTVAATLRPSGKIMIHGTIYDAMSDGEFLAQDTPIRVLYLDGSVIVVSRDEKNAEQTKE